MFSGFVLSSLLAYLVLGEDGLPSSRSIETSKGVLRIPFPLTLVMLSVPGAKARNWGDSGCVQMLKLFVQLEGSCLVIVSFKHVL